MCIYGRGKNKKGSSSVVYLCKKDQCSQTTACSDFYWTPKRLCQNGEVESAETSPRHYLGSSEFKMVNPTATKLPPSPSPCITLNIIHQPQ